MNNGGRATLNNCYGLPRQLLDDEKDVSIPRFIKREHSDVKDLIKKVATTPGVESKLPDEYEELLSKRICAAMFESKIIRNEAVND